jgi:hypothetical protein
MDILEQIYTQKLQDQIKVLNETIEIYKQYVDTQNKQIETLREQLDRSIALNDDLVETAKKALNGAKVELIKNII